ncbi:ferredoxin [Mycolicibacterium poriferae]|uniref:ferredoxin n=1 Tax=Mycolicibacterium poriferae TaxID=39694 RepID=UPI0024BBCA6B|nr:(4Fe-4S)-binding protein [Mycolicibacterium poriferae]
MKVIADREICMAAGVCVMTADAVFDQDPDGLVVLATEKIDAAQEKLARNAVRMCPSGALRAVAD